MIEHQKRVLQGVSHNRELFKKELIKSINWLPPYEQFLLKKWVQENYSQHIEIVNAVIDININKLNEEFY